MKRLVLPLAFLLLGACGLDPSKIASHRLFVTDSTEFDADGAIQFAVLGNTRGMHPVLDGSALGHGDVTHAMVGDVIASVATGGPKFAVFTGDLVRSSSNAEWSAFDEQFVGLLDGASTPVAPTKRIPAIAVAGDRDGAGDAGYRGLDGSFPGTGASIGHGRIATWSKFDVRTKDARWRFVVLDSAKKTMGSRWREQLAWIPGAVVGQFAGIVVLVHDPAVSLAGSRGGSEATKELLAVLERTAPMDSVKAVVFAGPAASQAILPEGKFGAIHIGAGGGGAPADDLHRVGTGPSPARLVPGLDNVLQAGLRTWGGAKEIPARAIERATSTGAFKGTPGVYDAGNYPTYGWWKGGLDGETLSMAWRRWQPDGTFKTVWTATYTRKTGWTGSP